MDHEILEENIKDIINEGVHGIIAAGINGEFSSLTINERKAVFETIINVAGDKVTVITAAYANSLKNAKELIKHSKEIGASAAIITTPFFFRRPSDEGLFGYFEKIFEFEKKLPILLCNVPIYSLIPIKHSIIEKLHEKYKNLVGIKDMSGKPESITAYAGVFNDLSVLIGSDRLLFHGLNIGCDGAVTAIGSVLPKYVLNIYSIYQSGDIDKAWIEQEKLSGIRSILKRFPSRAGLKYIYEQLSGRRSYVRPPLRNLTSIEKESLEAILYEHGLLQQE